MVMRFEIFENFDPKQLEGRLTDIEAADEALRIQLGQLAAEQRRAEANAVQRNDFAKAKAEHSCLKVEHQKLHSSVHDLSTQFFSSNRQLSRMVTEAKGGLERAVQKLEKEKANVSDHSSLLDRLSKLEGSMRDNRQILSGTGSQDINAFVKRIILNLEDKIMLLERKVDCLAEGRPIEPSDRSRATSPDKSPVVSARGGGGANLTSGKQESHVQAIGAELSAMQQAVSQLKQDVQLSKVEMDHVLEQGQLHADLAQRLSVYVEKAGEDAGSVEPGAALSMNRVQVMITAAARQLVAGSKWVTKETFDSRLGEVRKEYLGASRQLQAQLEEVGGLVLKVMPSLGTGQRLPKVAKTEGSVDGVEWASALPADLGQEKQVRYMTKERPPGSPASTVPGLNLAVPGQRKAGQSQRPLSERGTPRDRTWGG